MLIQKENNSKYWLNKPQGFLWYNEEQMQESPSHFRSKLSSEVKQEPHDQRIEALKQQFNRSQRIALDNPTLENVIKAQRLQKQIMEKSQKFAAMWQLATLIDPSLTNSNEPVNSLHKRLYQELLEQNNGQKLRILAENWGLILQVSDNCPYCHAFVPIVQQFANKYGFQLLLASSKGTNFHNIKTMADTGLLQALNPENVVPVYLISSNGKRIYPISRSLISEDKIIENIIAINLHYQNLEKK
ncbi:MAG: conjugal transfer protein TraF [Rickettsia endosymbiont of Platyusa sonomae]|nr:conjugal transfer protein TraF [Rickettsia endosymbiont of Platyusa sonomae]